LDLAQPVADRVVGQGIERGHEPGLSGAHDLLGDQRPRQLVGSLCPQPWITVDGRRVRLDDVLGENFAVVTVGALTPSLSAAARVLDAPVIDVADGPLAAWLRRGRTRAAVVRPDRVVLDVAGRDGSLPRITSWAPLLSTPVPPSSRRSAA